jgi:hypothetical protein
MIEIRREIYPGPMRCFRALMQQLNVEIGVGRGWVSSSGEVLGCHECPQPQEEDRAVRGSWQIISRSPASVASAPLAYGSVDFTVCAGIEAFEQPNGTTLLIFLDAYKPFPTRKRLRRFKSSPIGAAFMEFIEMIRREMQQQGGEPTPAEAGAVKPRGGRPRNEDDQWAYEQVRICKREATDVYLEWKERIGDRKDKLASPRDSFNKAIKPRQGGMEKTEEMD